MELWIDMLASLVHTVLWCSETAKWQDAGTSSWLASIGVFNDAGWMCSHFSEFSVRSALRSSFLPSLLAYECGSLWVITVRDGTALNQF
ncbi:hypothetical protein DFH08DRAFT_829042, partial [Mycena albidolilacea]